MACWIIFVLTGCPCTCWWLECAAASTCLQFWLLLDGLLCNSGPVWAALHAGPLPFELNCSRSGVDLLFFLISPEVPWHSFNLQHACSVSHSFGEQTVDCHLPFVLWCNASCICSALMLSTSCTPPAHVAITHAHSANSTSLQPGPEALGDIIYPSGKIPDITVCPGLSIGQ